ncbi:MAG: MFS transporter [Firmicutes bacterium]|nr:MFS transporter [Bacillota bacterium]
MANRHGLKRTGLLIGMILLAANLRPTITGVGPLITPISQGTHLPSAVSGLVTTTPLVAFGLVSLAAPGVARRFGLERALFLGLVLLLVGTLLRSFAASAWGLLAGMFLVGSGVALANVLLPSLVKRDFASQIGLVTGIYVTVMNVFAGLASGISVPLARALPGGWRGALAIWALLTLLALIWWIPYLGRRHPPAPRTAGSARTLWRSWLAWQLTLFMGLQSLLFYVSIAWLPTLLHSRGLSLTTAGWLVFAMQMVGLPWTFAVPILAGRLRQQFSLVLGVSLTFFLGLGGLLVTHGLWALVLSMVLLGFGTGSSISLALAFFGLRTRHHDTAGAISGMAQSFGYLLAAIGPFAIGYLYTVTQAWTIPLVLLLAVAVLMGFFGLGSARDRYIDAPPASPSGP